MSVNRRNFLKIVGLGGLALHTPVFGSLSSASSNISYNGKFFLFCSFDGGWDQMLCTDPRDQTRPEFSAGKPISPFYDEMSGIEDVVEGITEGTGVYAPGNGQLNVGPAMYELARDHWQDLCIVRGVDMGTLTHAVGRRYSITGKFPRGLQASGSSLVTAATAGMGQSSPIPNLVLGMETFNEGLPTWASGLTVRQPSEILSILEPLSTPLSASSTSAISKYLEKRSALASFLNTDGIVDQFERSVPQAADIASGIYAQHFDLTNPTAAAIAQNAFGITSNSQLSLAEGQAFMAAQAISNGLAQSVSIQLATGLDHHDEDLLTDHAPALRSGFGALGKLITYLKTTLDQNGKPYWDRTVVLATSEFGRSPFINSQYGRDHHLTNSILLAGAGIKGNTVVGGTNNVDYQRMLVNPVSGQAVAPGAGGKLIRPSDVHATVLEAMGLSWAHLENQVPTILEAALA